MSGTSYESWTKAELVAEFYRRGLDRPYMSDLMITARTTKDELLSALYFDDFADMPCGCPICSTYRDLEAGNPESEGVQRMLAYLGGKSRSGEAYESFRARYEEAVALKRRREPDA